MYLAQSSTGEYVAPLFKVVTITLLCSWLMALTLTPLLCASFLKVKGDPEQGAYGSRFYMGYKGVLVSALKHPWLSVAGVLVIFFAGIQSFRLLPNIFFPPSDNPSFIVKLDMPAGTAIEETSARVKQLEDFMRRELLATEARSDGAKHWATFIGEGGPRFYLAYNPEPPTPEFAVLVVSATTREAAEVGVEKVREFIAEALPDARATVEPRALGPPSVAPVLFEISGRDPNTVFAIVNQLKHKLESIRGTTNIRDDWGQRVKKLEVEIDHARARRAGLSHQDIAVSLQTALSGFEVTQYREQDELIPVVLRSVLADRDDIGKLETLSVFAQATGRAVPLKAVADIGVVWEPSRIRRKDRYKTVSVMSNLDGTTTAAEVNEQVIPWLEQESRKWRVGYGWEMGGEMKEAEKGNNSINEKMPIAMFIIALLLVIQFNSIRRPLIILLTIPLAVVGVGLGLVIFNSYFGFMTLLGVIALFGIVINNAIVLIDRIKTEIEENGLPAPQAIVEASQRRLRPILLTTFTTILGLIPLWLGGGPMWRPMAIAIVCGLAFSTLLTLGVVPVLYSLFFGVSFKGFELTPVAEAGAK
jgi:multidrug efflux pump subunit AcrB